MKAGTTWLYGMLCHSDSYFAPLLKEWHYLTFLGEHGECNRETLISRPQLDYHFRTFYRPAFDVFLRQFGDMQGQALGPNMMEHLAWWRLYLFEDRNLDTWRRLISDPSRKPSFDICPEYALIDWWDILKGAQEVVPELRVVIMLRDPLSRLVSNIGWFGDEAFIATNLNGWLHVLRHNEAATIIGRYAAFFPHDRIFIGYMEDVRNHPQRFAGALATFLNMKTPTYIPPPANVASARITDGNAFAGAVSPALQEVERLSDWIDSPLLVRWERRIRAGILDADDLFVGEFCSGTLLEQRTTRAGGANSARAA